MPSVCPAFDSSVSKTPTRTEFILFRNSRISSYHYYYFKPGSMSWDFKNYRKSVKLERPLIRMII